MGYNVTCPYVDTWYRKQMRVISISSTSNIDHIFVVKYSKSSPLAIF